MEKSIRMIGKLLLSVAILVISVPFSSISNAAETTEWTYSYSGKVETFTAPYTGVYHFDTRGGCGGGFNLHQYPAGYGGKAAGDVLLKQGDKVYIRVGGNGTISSGGTVNGGWNGGGSATGSNNSSGGGATSVAYTTDALNVIKEDKLLMVAGGGGGAGPTVAKDMVRSIYNGGGGDAGGSTDGASGGTQSFGYSKGVGQNASSGHAGGGGYWGGYASHVTLYGGGGGSGYLNEDVVMNGVSAMTTSGVHSSVGYVKIKYNGAFESTVKFIAGPNGTINGKDSVTLKGAYGSVQPLPTITKIAGYEYLNFDGWQHAGGDAKINTTNNTIEFGSKNSFYEAKFSGGKVEWNVNQTDGNAKVSVNASLVNLGDVTIDLQGRHEGTNSWTTLGRYVSDNTYRKLNMNTVSVPSNGSKSTTYSVIIGGWYKIALKGAGGGQDGNTAGGSGALLGFDIYLNAGDSVYLEAGNKGTDSDGNEGWKSGGSGIAGSNGGSGYWSGGGGGGSGIKVNGSLVAIAGGGGGGNWAYGYGGRVSTSGDSGNNGSSRAGQDGVKSNGNDDTGGGGGGWVGGLSGNPPSRGGYGGRSDYSINVRTLRNVTESGGSTGGGGGNGSASITPLDLSGLKKADGKDEFTIQIPDTKAPDTPERSFITVDASSSNIVATLEVTKDYGNKYFMRLSNLSEVKELEYISGFDGWLYVTNNYETYTITSTSGVSKQAATSNKLNIPFGSGYSYLHVAAIDKAGNISGTVSLFINYERYFVVYNGNGAMEGSVPYQDCEYGKTYQISSNANPGFVRTGFIFQNWNTEPDGSGITYTPGTQFKNLILSNKQNVVLYAQWKPDANAAAKLYVDPNGGVYKGLETVQTFTWNPADLSYAHYNYSGGYQIYTVPADGWYFLEAAGGSGGNDACPGAGGGYVQAYVKLKKGQVLYISVGQAGWTHYGNQSLASNPSYGAGGRAGNTGSGGNWSGVGGGATMIATSLYGNGDIRNYANDKNSILLVAGGGGGGSASVAGAGGEVLYVGSGSSYSQQSPWTGGKLGTAFGTGQNPGSSDGGGGGGGWIGGRYGQDGGTMAGGGASFVNTSRGCYNATLVPNYRYGHGFARITAFPDDGAHALTPDPYRTGWSFQGWEINWSKSKGDVKLYHNTQEPLWWAHFKKGTEYVQAIWKRTMSVTLDADQTKNYVNGQSVSRGESTWTQTITDNPTKFFRWDSAVVSGGKKFTDDMTREKGIYTVQFARNDGNGSTMQLVSLGKTGSSAINGYVGTFGSDEIVMLSGGNYAGEVKTYPRFRGWSTERFVKGEYLGSYPGTIIASSGSWINLKTQNANWDSNKQYLYNMEGNVYPTGNAVGFELDARLAKYNTKLGISPYDKLNLTIYPTWCRSTIKLPDARRNSNKTGNGETPDLFIGWFTRPQLDADTANGGEFVGRAGDVVVIDKDMVLYPWFNKAPTIIKSEIGNNGDAGTFWEGQPVSYEQLLTLVNASDKDNYVDLNKANSEVQWNGVDAWNDGLSDWNDGEQAWGDDVNAYTPGEDSHGVSQDWNEDVADTIDWETFSATNAWKTLYTLNVDAYLHDYVYNSPDFASYTTAQKNDIINSTKQRLLTYQNQYDTNGQDDNRDFQVFITGISYYCDGVDAKGVPTKSNPDVSNIDNNGNYVQSHTERLYTNNYSATGGRYDGYVLEYDDMYDVNANGLQTDTPFVGKIVIHYAIVDNGTFDFYNDKYVTTANGYRVDSHIVVEFDLETEIKFDNRPKYETHSLVIYSNDPDWNADNVVEKVLEKQVLTDVEDNKDNHPWWYKNVTTPALIDTKVILGIENITFQYDYEHEHPDVCERIKQITDIEELFRLKESSNETDVQAFEHITNFDVIVDAHDQWNKYSSDTRCGQNKTERTFKVILFNNEDDDGLFYSDKNERLRYINSDWVHTLGETSYWSSSEYGLGALENTFTNYVDRHSLSSNTYSGVLENPTPDDENRKINITVNDYSD